MMHNRRRGWCWLRRHWRWDVALSIAFAASFGAAVNAYADETVQARCAIINELLVEGFYSEAAPRIDLALLSDPDDGLMQYNAACVQARLGALDAAELHLRMAVKNGYLRFSKMQRDADLKSLRGRTVLQSMLAARDAADGIYAARRNEQWLAQLDPQPYRVVRDRLRNIDVISMLDGDSMNAAMQRIGETADVLAPFFGGPLRNRITIVVLDEDDAQRIFSNSRIRGNYRHEVRELVVTNLGRSMQHELAHAYHHNQMDVIGQEQPMWVQEGLASLFEAYRIVDGGIEFLPNDRQTSMKFLLEHDAAHVSWRDMFNASAAEFRSEAMMDYPMARTVLEYVAAHGSVQLWYEHYIAEFDEDRTGAVALAQTVGVSLNEAEGDWRRWVAARSGSNAEREDARRLALTPLPRREIPVQADAERAADKTTITVSIDPTAAKAAALYEQVRPDVLAGKYESALPALREVVALSPGNANARYDLALACIVTGDMDGARAQQQTLAGMDQNLARLVEVCLKPATDKRADPGG